MNVIFPKDYFEPSIDESYVFESEMAVKHGNANIFFLSYEDLLKESSSLKIQGSVLREKENTLWRGWQMKPGHYGHFCSLIQDARAIPLTSPTAYRTAHMLSESYRYISDKTPKTVFIEDSRIAGTNLSDIVDGFGGRAFVKDYVKSGCSLTSDMSEMDMHEAVKEFKKKRDYAYTGGISIREWSEFHGEMRGMFIGGKLAAHASRDNGVFSEPNEIFPFDLELPSPFYTVDVAKNSDNEWMIVETGDGQVSEIPDFILPEVYEALAKL